MVGRDVRCGGTVSATAGNLALDVVGSPSQVPLRVLPGGESTAVGARQVAAQVVHLLLEALAGRTVFGYQGLTVSGPVAVPQVLSCWVQQASERAAEGGAVVLFRGRVHAFALRLELRRGRWRCTEVETTALDHKAPTKPTTSHLVASSASASPPAPSTSAAPALASSRSAAPGPVLRESAAPSKRGVPGALSKPALAKRAEASAAVVAPAKSSVTGIPTRRASSTASDASGVLASSVRAAG